MRCNSLRSISELVRQLVNSLNQGTRATIANPRNWFDIDRLLILRARTDDLLMLFSTIGNLPQVPLLSSLLYRHKISEWAGLAQ